jgi:exopolysaccharide biosynthesis predicted pyruvyltransferase EpsI
MKFVFPDDILVGIDDVFFQPNFNSLVKNCTKNKIVIFIQNIQKIPFKYKDLALNNHPDHSVFSMSLNSYEILQKKLNYKELYYIPDYIINWSNFFNYKINFVKNNNTLILIENSNNEINENKIKKMVPKYISNITYNIINITKLSEQNYKDSIIDTIKEYKYIITDNIYIMKLSAIYSTSCVVMEKNQTKEMNDIFKNLDYIKYIHDIKDLEKNLIELINITSLNFNYTKIYNQYYDKIISEFR